MLESPLELVKLSRENIQERGQHGEMCQLNKWIFSSMSLRSTTFPIFNSVT